MSTGQHNSINLNGGIDLILSHLDKTKTREIISNHLGQRHYRAQYSYSDTVLTWTMNLIAGYRRLEQSFNLRESLLNHPLLKKGMTPDTISRSLRELAVENKYYTFSDSNSKNSGLNNTYVKDPNRLTMHLYNEVNLNPKFNELALDLAIEYGLLVPGEKYPLDIDATLIDTNVSDAKRPYKGESNAYAPMVVILGGIPVYTEIRNGNSNARFRIKEVLEEAIELIESKGIGIKYVRSDSAAGNQKVTGYLLKKNITFYIRIPDSKRSWRHNPSIFVESYKIEGLEIAYIKFRMADDQKRIRWIDYRNPKIKTKDGKSKAFGIITNDSKRGWENVIKIYNERGEHEKRFADLKEMGWKYMKHHELKFNAVQIHLTMIAFIMLTYSKKWAASKAEWVKETFRPKTFVDKFVKVVIRWVDGRIEFLNRQNLYYMFRGPT